LQKFLSQDARELDDAVGVITFFTRFQDSLFPPKPPTKAHTHMLEGRKREREVSSHCSLSCFGRGVRGCRDQFYMYVQEDFQELQRRVKRRKHITAALNSTDPSIELSVDLCHSRDPVATPRPLLSGIRPCRPLPAAQAAYLETLPLSCDLMRLQPPAGTVRSFLWESQPFRPSRSRMASFLGHPAPRGPDLEERQRLMKLAVTTRGQEKLHMSTIEPWLRRSQPCSTRPQMERHHGMPSAAVCTPILARTSGVLRHHLAKQATKD
jgi:hypothetical protein